MNCFKIILFELLTFFCSSRMINIQSSMSERALELLALPDDDQPRYLLDLGCGTGLSGEIIEEKGHYHWIGVDISSAMLSICKERQLDNGDTILCDLGHGLPFRAGMFSGAISISALQWLCNAYTNEQKPAKRLYQLFSSLYACLIRGAKAVFQFYPQNADQIELVTKTAMKAGFFGGVVIDFPNSTKAKKIFLVLFTGDVPQTMPKALTGEDEVEERNSIDYESKRKRFHQLRNTKAPFKSRQWILDKKERFRRKGKEVRNDTKYTARRRSGRF